MYTPRVASSTRMVMRIIFSTVSLCLEVSEDQESHAQIHHQSTSQCAGRGESPLRQRRSDMNYELPGLVNVYNLLLKMAIEILDFPIKHGDVP